MPQSKLQSLCRSEIVLIDKPAGVTSFDVIRILRKYCGIRKMGHGGTLDPLATGLLVVGIGMGTKLLKDIIGLSKVYEARVLIGIRTATGDLEGIIEETKDAQGLSESKVLDAVYGMRGTLMLPVPKYSAVKIKGIPLYRSARSGKKVTSPIKEMEVIDAVVRSIEKGTRSVIDIVWTVRSGTYIRSLAEELGKRLGHPATLQFLRRTKVGDMRVEDAVTLFDIKSALPKQIL